jgi:hypothetical protein
MQHMSASFCLRAGLYCLDGLGTYRAVIYNRIGRTKHNDSLLLAFYLFFCFGGEGTRTDDAYYMHVGCIRSSSIKK